jgi:hypothetical protein
MTASGLPMRLPPRLAAPDRGRRHGLPLALSLSACCLCLGGMLCAARLEAWQAPAAGQLQGPRDEGPAAPTARLQSEVAALRVEVEALKQELAAAQSRRLDEIERRLEVLADEIQRLKLGETMGPAGAGAVGGAAAAGPGGGAAGGSADAAAGAAAADRTLAPAAAKVYRGEHGLSVGGYGEALAQQAGGEDRLLASADPEVREGRGTQADLRRAVLYVGYKWSDRWVMNSEIEYEHANGESGVEFAYLDFLWRREVNLRGGLLLVPMGLINELHEPTVFLGADRPEVERFILPDTWSENGVGLFGELGPIAYRSYLLAGFDAAGFTASGLQGGRQEGNQSRARDLGWVARGDWTATPGLLAGGSLYLGRTGQGLRAPGGGEIGAPIRIFEGHADWRWHGLQLRALGASAELDDVALLDRALDLSGISTLGHRLYGYYLEAGYDLLAGAGERALIPFARWEAYRTQAALPAGYLGDPANDVRSLTLGFNFKPLEQVVVKSDYQAFRDGAGRRSHETHLLLGYIF